MLVSAFFILVLSWTFIYCLYIISFQRVFPSNTTLDNQQVADPNPPEPLPADETENKSVIFNYNKDFDYYSYSNEHLISNNQQDQQDQQQDQQQAQQQDHQANMNLLYMSDYLLKKCN